MPYVVLISSRVLGLGCFRRRDLEKTDICTEPFDPFKQELHISTSRLQT